MTEDRVASAGHHGREQPTFEPDCAVADGIDTGMNGVRPAHSMMLDRAPSEPEPLELPDRDQPMLSAGEPRNAPIDMHGWSPRAGPP